MQVTVPAHPLVVTSDPDLLDDLLRLAAAAGVEPEVVTDPGAARPSWAAAPLVLVGADLVAGAARRGLPRRDGVVVVVPATGDAPRVRADVWEQAVGLGAEHVVVLPTADGWLVDRLADALERDLRRARVLAVVGARGGAGASTLAAALAVTGAAEGLPSLLVDGDPWGAGLDLVLGCEDRPGTRWSDLAATRGRLGAAALRDALPSAHGVHVLSFDRTGVTDVPPEVRTSVLAAGRRGGGLVVVDVGRVVDDTAARTLAQVDAALLLVPAEVRAAAAATRLADAVAASAPEVSLVVRVPGPAGLSSATVAEVLGLPLAGELRSDRAVAVAGERGLAPATSGRGPLAELCRRLLESAPSPRRRRAA